MPACSCDELAAARRVVFGWAGFAARLAFAASAFAADRASANCFLKALFPVRFRALEGCSDCACFAARASFADPALAGLLERPARRRLRESGSGCWLAGMLGSNRSSMLTPSSSPPPDRRTSSARTLGARLSEALAAAGAFAALAACVFPESPESESALAAVMRAAGADVAGMGTGAGSGAMGASGAASSGELGLPVGKLDPPAPDPPPEPASDGASGRAPKSPLPAPSVGREPAPVPGTTVPALTSWPFFAVIILLLRHRVRYWVAYSLRHPPRTSES